MKSTLLAVYDHRIHKWHLTADRTVSTCTIDLTCGTEPVKFKSMGLVPFFTKEMNDQDILNYKLCHECRKLGYESFRWLDLESEPESKITVDEVW